MADTFKLQGTYEAKPASGAYSGDYTVYAALDETLSLSKSVSTKLSLDADPAESVPFGDITNAHVVAIRVTGGKVKARLTSADGATQAVPVDSLLIVISESVPFTAIDLTRVAGTTTKAYVFLGMKAS